MSEMIKEHNHPVGEKCDMGCPMMGSMDMEEPLGGSTSFAELETWAVNTALAEYIDEISDRYKTMMDNILNDHMISSADKAAKALALTKEYQGLVQTPDPNMVEHEEHEVYLEQDDDKEKKGFLSSLFGQKRNIPASERNRASDSDFAGPHRSFPILKPADVMAAFHSLGRASGDPGPIRARIISIAKRKGFPLPMSVTDSKKELPAVGGFKVYEDTEGKLRWLSLSSNAFEDLDSELFTTKALEEAIEYADQNDQRGPLLVYHVPSAAIGQTDYQALAGRFLVESGTFDDTPLGRKAVEYFTNSGDEHQVSIGYQYKDGDEKDGQYDWLRIKERSVCPYGTAANPWTDFKVIGENPMDARKVEALEKIFGKDLAAGVIASAEEKTKELEASVKFKDKDPEPVVEDKKEEPVTEPVTETANTSETVVTHVDATPGITTEQLTSLATLITELSVQVGELGSVKEAVASLQDEVKALKKSDDEKIADIISPRWTLPGGIRPTDRKDNVLPDQSKVKELLKEVGGEESDTSNANPAMAYVNDLLGARTRIG